MTALATPPSMSNADAAPAAPFAAVPAIGSSLQSTGRKALQIFADLAAVGLAMIVAHTLRFLLRDAEPAVPHDDLLLGLTTLPLWPIVFYRYRLYSARAVSSRLEELGRIVHGILVSTILMAVVAFMFGLSASRGWLIILSFTALVTCAIDREATRMYFRRLRTAGKMFRPVVIVGGNDEAEAIATMLSTNPNLGYQVLGFTADGALPGALTPGQAPVLGPLEGTVDVVAATGATTVIIATTAVPSVQAGSLARRLQDRGVHVEMSSGLQDIAAERLTVRSLGRHPVFYLEPTVHHGWRAAAKRAFDLSVSVVGLIMVSPLLLVLAVAVKATSKGGVFFSQERVGRRGETFRVLKLRTMVVDAEARLAALKAQNEADGPLFKMKDDPRVTKVGKLLRKTSLDELPQLWNVVRGEMSLVGPRPALASEVDSWTAETHNRLRVKPGITGMWQVSGRSNSTFDEYVRLDLFYVDNWTLAADLSILLRTVPAVVRSKGAY